MSRAVKPRYRGPAPLRSDGRSGWILAPRAAWEAGQGGLIRYFDTVEEAKSFLGKPAQAAARKAKSRQRARDGDMVVRALVPAEVISALIVAGRLTD